MKFQRPVSHFRFSLRRELRLALFAAMETCWTYALLALLAAGIGVRPLSAWAIFLAYWGAMFAGRLLPRLKWHWGILQMITIILAIVTLLIVARVELATAPDPSDMTWLAQLLRGILLSPTRLTVEQIIGLGIFFAMVRGLGFAQRPLTLWFVGFRFRVGIVILAFSSALASGLPRIELTSWVVLFFSVSLLSIALARVEENFSETHLGVRWAFTLSAAIALTLFLAFLVLQILTLDTATMLARALWPLWALISLGLILVSIPAAYLAEWFAEFLRPLLNNLGKFFDQLGSLLPRAMVEQMQNTSVNETFVTTLGAVGQTIFILTLIIGTGWLLARALHRRLTREEAETYTREALAADERVRRTTTRQPRAAPPRSRSISAESIRRIYAALCAHARDAGMPRQTAETPYEFLPRLSQTWVAVRDDLHEITEAYVATHYAERDLSSELTRVRAAWERIKRNT